jgi:hypothetical protein
MQDRESSLLEEAGEHKKSQTGNEVFCLKGFG